MGIMGRALLSDALWKEVEPLIPEPPPQPRGGRPWVSARKCLLGMLFVLRTGSAWNTIPSELGAAPPATCHRRFQQWTRAGVWEAMWLRVLRDLGKIDELDLSRAVIDSASVRAVSGGRMWVRIPRIVANPGASAT